MIAFSRGKVNPGEFAACSPGKPKDGGQIPKKASPSVDDRHAPSLENFFSRLPDVPILAFLLRLPATDH
jgi:hypothetical protein